ncbi:MAG: DNA polymerase III subunit beta [Simkania negevensis]|nr:DNA polymerase III subunit beta [Simkania negevensis]
MKARIGRFNLVSLIGKMQSVITNKPILPILSNILIKVADGKVTISATDLTISMRDQISAEVEEEGAITLPARPFFQLIRELSAPEITLSSSSAEIATISAGNSFFKLHGIHESEFPSLPDFSEAPHFSLRSKELKEMLSRSAFAAAKEDSRHVLNAILMQIEDNRATFVAADGKRLAKIYTPIPFTEPKSRSYLLPLKAADEMIKLLDEEEEVEIYLLSDKIALEVGGVTFITKLLSGEYPDVELIIPKKGELDFILHREELMALLRQISLFTGEKNQSVQFHFQKGELVLTASTSDFGEGKVSMPLDYSGEPLDIALNPLFFYEILRHSKDETISFSITSAYNPSLITDSSTAKFVIMPMRLASV